MIEDMLTSNWSESELAREGDETLKKLVGFKYVRLEPPAFWLIRYQLFEHYPRLAVSPTDAETSSLLTEGLRFELYTAKPSIVASRMPPPV